MMVTRKSVIAIGIVVLILLGATAALFWLSGEEAPDGDESVELIQVSDVSRIKKLEISNESGSYTVINKTPDNASMTIEGWEDKNFNQSSLETLLTGLCGLKSTMTISENKEDLAQYGFDQPTATATIVLDDGSEVRLQVGKETKIGTQGFYVTTDGAEGFTLQTPPRSAPFPLTKAISEVKRCLT
jgi:hypothetical protein